jgi:hypothetical protein
MRTELTPSRQAATGFNRRSRFWTAVAERQPAQPDAGHVTRQLLLAACDVSDLDVICRLCFARFQRNYRESKFSDN